MGGFVAENAYIPVSDTWFLGWQMWKCQPVSVALPSKVLGNT